MLETLGADGSAFAHYVAAVLVVDCVGLTTAASPAGRVIE